jgi:hypothetical protein
MVIRLKPHLMTRAGALMVDALVAIALLASALLPLAYSVASEKRYVRAAYHRAVALELVDGEMEVLAAGGWHAFTNGTHELPLPGTAATNLPPGRLELRVAPGKLRLEWRPQARQQGGSVLREVEVK